MNTEADTKAAVLSAVAYLNNAQSPLFRECVSVRRVHDACSAWDYDRRDIRCALDALCEDGLIVAATPHLSLDYRIA